jgi:hypothetical protein
LFFQHDDCWSCCFFTFFIYGNWIKHSLFHPPLTYTATLIELPQIAMVEKKGVIGHPPFIQVAVWMTYEWMTILPNFAHFVPIRAPSSSTAHPFACMKGGWPITPFYPTIKICCNCNKSSIHTIYTGPEDRRELVNR